MTTRLPIRLATGLAVLMGALLLAALLWPVMPPEPPTVAAPTAAPVQLKIAASAAEREQMAERILARPLFRADRKPDPSLAATDGRPSQLPRLSGVTLAPSGATAIFQPEGGGKPILVGEGGSVAGWTVRSITAGKVVLAGAGGQRDLSLTPPSSRSRQRPS